MKNNEITLDQARRVLEVVDAGLSSGLGNPKPGQMCVEAAVCYALGQPHGDEPKCVNNAVRRFKIRLNDSPWSSNEARAAGMRRLAIAQLGTSDPSFDEKKFVEVLVDQTIRKIVPYALRCAIRAADGEHKAALEEAAMRCERDGNLEAAKKARSAASTAYAAYAASTAYAAYAASTAAAAAANAAKLANAGDYAADAAADSAYAAATAASTANAASSYRDPKDTVFCISADIGVQALRAAGAHGIKLMDQLIPA